MNLYLDHIHIANRSQRELNHENFTNQNLFISQLANQNHLNYLMRQTIDKDFPSSENQILPGIQNEIHCTGM